MVHIGAHRLTKATKRQYSHNAHPGIIQFAFTFSDRLFLGREVGFEV